MTSDSDFKAKGYRSKSEMKRREIMEEKPKEFWIKGETIYDGTTGSGGKQGEIIHVIEYSAVTALEVKCAELEKERDNAATTMAIIASKQLADLTLANDSLAQEVARLRSEIIKNGWDEVKVKVDADIYKAHADKLASAAQLFCNEPHVVSYEPLKTALAAYREFRGDR